MAMMDGNRMIPAKEIEGELWIKASDLYQARSAPVQEPVWIQPDHLQKAKTAPFLCRVEPHKRDDFVPLYTTQPAAQRQWVGLTDEDYPEVRKDDPVILAAFKAGAKWAETKLKEKNT